MAGKSVTLPPDLDQHQREVRPSPMSNFLRRMGGRVLGRGRSTEKKKEEERAGGGEEKSKPAPSSKSPARFVGHTLSRLSMRRKEKISLCEEDASSSTDSPSTKTSPRGLPPRPAISENDLRNITIRRGSTDIPITPLAGVSAFMSEDNLASAECGGAPYRTPSYVRISCTLNGYRSPTRLNQTPITSTPTRPKPQPNVLGKSLVERRLDQLRNPRACPETPAISTSPDRSSSLLSDHSSSTPTSSRMGNAACTPTPIKSLISQFDKMQLCSGEEEVKENVQPHSIVINEQPMGDSEKKDPSRLRFDDDDNEGRTEIGRIEGEKKEEEEVNHNVIRVEEKKEEEEESRVRDGAFFVDLLAATRASLSTTAKEHEEELERMQSSISEPAAAALRIVIGKTLLLNGKKLKKFDELVQKNLNPRADDPQPATIDDLEGYWGLVEIELTDIASSVDDVSAWRARGWEAEEEKSPSQTSRDGSDSGRGASEASTSRPSSRGRPVPAKTAAAAAPKSAAAVERAEKMKEAAEKRRREMAEMKARMRREKEEGEKKKEEESEKTGNAVLMVL